jgi:hypothetical protein
VSLGAAAANVSNIQIRFWTDVLTSGEGALIDNVKPTGDPMRAVPEPAPWRFWASACSASVI